MPVVHEHALDLNSLANNTQLAEHAIAFHADCLGIPETGLHVHFMLLDQFTDSILADSHDSGHHAVDAVETVLRLEQQQLAAMEFNAAQSQSNQSDLLPIAEDLRFSSVADAGYLQTRVLSTPAFAVLCVCLC